MTIRTLPAVTAALALLTGGFGMMNGNAAEQSTAPRERAMEIVEVRKVWDEAPHNAFTDLVRADGKFYCTFRESTQHVPQDHSGDGRIRVLVSADGTKWASHSLIEEKGVDLRDPKLSIMPDGRVMLLMGGSYYDHGKLLKRRTRVSFAKPGVAGFEKPVPVTIDPKIATDLDWLWRVTWHDHVAYGVLYDTTSTVEWPVHLVSSTDGITYNLVKTLDITDRPNESTVRFLHDGRMIIVARRDQKAEQRRTFGAVGVAGPPFTQWTWKDMSVRIGGQQVLVLPDDSMLIGTRLYLPKVRMAVGWLGLDGSLSGVVDLPSGGDCSYPGMVLYDKQLWVSYYSSHEGKTSIYMARLALQPCGP